MESQKILNLLNASRDSKFVITKWNIVNDQSNASYGAGNEIIYSTGVLKSNLTGDITIIGYNLAIQVPFRNCLPFTKGITKIDGKTISDGKDFDLVMPMC